MTHKPQHGNLQEYIYIVLFQEACLVVLLIKKTDSNLKQASVNQTHSHATQ